MVDRRHGHEQEVLSRPARDDAGALSWGRGTRRIGGNDVRGTGALIDIKAHTKQELRTKTATALDRSTDV